MDYKIYEYSGFPQYYLRSSHPNGDLIGSKRPFGYFSKLMNKGLIALHPETRELVFLGGYLFLDDIKEALRKTQLTIIRYIELRYYNYEPIDIKLIEHSKEAYLIGFFSQVLHQNITLHVPRDGEDKIMK
ncbi:MAG: hypothetical protein ACI9YL_000506 [Luteibaculaceae bacterium]